MYLISFVMIKLTCGGEYSYSNMQTMDSVIAVHLFFQILQEKLENNLST